MTLRRLLLALDQPLILREQPRSNEFIRYEVHVVKITKRFSKFDFSKLDSSFVL